MLRLDGIRKQYDTRTGPPLVVLDGVSLALNAGDAIAIVGPSGSGKSTLLHVLGALDRPSAGTVQFAGTDPFQLDERGLAKFRNKRVGFVFQDHHLLPQLTVSENVLLPALAQRNASPALAAKAQELLRRVGLAERMTHRPAELSGGERQRAAVARALILEAPLLLADEPTGNLDRTTARNVGELLLELHRERNGVLVAVTHSAEFAAMFPRRLRMDAGRLIDDK